MIHPNGSVARPASAQMKEKNNTIEEVVSVVVSRRVWMTEPALVTAPPTAQKRADGARHRARHRQVLNAHMRPQHHEHAEEPDDDRGPAVDAHVLAQKERRESDGNERCGERDRGGFDERKPGQGREVDNMPTTLISPRPTWPSGRPVRTAALSSRRQA